MHVCKLPLLVNTKLNTKLDKKHLKMKPTMPIYSLQSLHGYLLAVHILI